MRKSPLFAAYTSDEVMDLKKRALIPLLVCASALILDSRCAADSARDALNLCIQTLIPGLFPMFVISTMLVPQLSGLRIPGLSRLLGIPEGSEGIFLLGCAGGFPVGAACIVQAVESGGMDRRTAERMLGISSFCGPAFLFGVIGSSFSLKDAGLLFLIQLESAVLTAAFWPSTSAGPLQAEKIRPVSLPEAMKRSTGSLASVCAWVTLAAVAAGFLRRWLTALLPETVNVILTGTLELTSGVFTLHQLQSPELQLVLCAFFVCFGGISVLLQIGSLATGAGLSMGACVAQKSLQGILGAMLTSGFLAFGPIFLLLGLLLPAGKIAVEISGRMMYNGSRKEGI